MDKFRLEYELKRRNISVSMLCEIIGMSKTAYYRKLKGTSEFTQGEIQKIIDLLEIDSPVGIFFADKVS